MLFNKQEFNFCDDYEFSFNPETLELKGTKKESRIAKLYGQDNYFSAIIGKNGCGKTSLANFFSEKNVYDFGYNHILIYELNGQVYFDSRLLPDEALRGSQIFEALEKAFTKINKDIKEYYSINQLSAISSGINAPLYKIKTVDDLKRNSTDFRGLDEIMKANEEFLFKYEVNFPFSYRPFEEPVIYTSNAFSPQHYISSESNFIDMSTAGLMRGDSESLNNGLDSNPKVFDHSQNEILRMVDLYKDERFHESSISLPLPEQLLVNFRDYDLKQAYNRTKGDNASSVIGSFDRCLENLIINLEKAKRNSTGNEFILINLIACGLGNQFRYAKEWTNSNEVALTLKKYEDRNRLQDFIHLLEELKENGVFSAPIRDHEPYDSKPKGYNCVSKLLDLVELVEEEFNRQMIDKDGLGILLPVENTELVNKFLNLYFESQVITHYLTFSWRPYLSSGELAQYSLYSRIYSQFKKHESLIVYLDEVETTIHPDLQRKLVSNLLELSKAFKKKVHFILASHSPILISDLSDDQILYLERFDPEVGESYTKVSKNILNSKGTFAANIHSLYNDNFFCEGTMGAVAEGCIQRMIKFLNDEPQELFCSTEDLQVFIELISEPIIRHKLQSMLDEKISKNKVLEENKVIQDLKNENQRLKDLLEGRKND